MQLHQAIHYGKYFANKEDKSYVIYQCLSTKEYSYISEEQWLRDKVNVDKDYKYIDKLLPKNK